MECKMATQGESACIEQCDDCKSFYQRMSDKNHAINDEDDIYDISSFEWTEYMVDWANRPMEEE